MGFVTGFTGGVTLTLGVAYLSILAHQRNRDAQSNLLRSQALVLNSALDPRPPPPPPSRSEIAAAARANLVESLKDRWNEEVENAVRWVQKTDWNEVREEAEDKISQLFNLDIGSSEGAAQGQIEKGLAESVSEKAAAAYQQSKAKGAQALENGIAKGRELSEKAKAVVGLPVAPISSPGEPTAVQKALQQRFERRQPEKRTVADVLQERYTPIERRDNTVLRGI